MPFEPFETVAVGRTGLTVTRLGLGGASIGGLFRPVDDATAEGVVAHAWALGVRSFDVAPLYGYGAAERRMGRVLAAQPRDAFVLSSKVGRLVRTTDEIRPGADIDRQASGGRDDAFYADVGDRRIVFDYSAEGVRRSVLDSLERLGLERIDILLIHDPDDYIEEALRGTYRALRRMRDEGLIGAIGAGMNYGHLLARLAREAEFDCFLLAGRYTLLDQVALHDLLPLAAEQGIAIYVGGPFNSGILADPHADHPNFNYGPATAEWIDKARRLDAVCRRHNVPLKAAAIQFPLGHPAVVSVLSGARSVAELDENIAMFQTPIPAALWGDLRAEGLLDAAAPTPQG
jgi:D-threo-aldose 1-dehydrogenase